MQSETLHDEFDDIVKGTYTERQSLSLEIHRLGRLT